MSNPYDDSSHSQHNGQPQYGQPQYGQPQYGTPYGQPYGYDPQGHYGAPTPPANRQAPQLAPGKFDLANSFEQAWAIMANNPVPWLVSAAIYVGVILAGALGGAAFSFIPAVIFANSSSASANEPLGTIFAGLSFVLLVASTIVSILWQMVVYRNAVEAVGGYRAELKDFFRLRRCGFILLVYIISGLLIILGLLGLIVGSVVVAYFLMFAVFAAALKENSIGDCLKTSVSVVKNNSGACFLLFLAQFAATLLASQLFIPMFFVTPFFALVYAHAYLTATGRAVQPNLQRP